MESGLTVRLSIVMAMRNAEATIAQTLESLLGQSFTDWELILLDDGSQDASVALARGMQMHVYKFLLITAHGVWQRA